MSQKIKIRAPTSILATNVDFSISWDEISDAIDKIYAKNTRSLSFEKLYKTIYDIIVGGGASRLYTAIETHTMNNLKNIKEQKFNSTLERSQFLKTLYTLWLHQCECFKLVDDLMLYMNKVYCNKERKLEIYDLELDLFRREIIVPINEELKSILFEDINSCRKMKNISKDKTDLWKALISMLETLEEQGKKDNYFITYIEPFLMANIEKFYTSYLNVEDLDVDSFLSKVENTKLFENELDNSFLNMDTTNKITVILEKTLVWDNVNDKIITYVRDYISSDNPESLKKLYLLSSNEDYTNNIFGVLKQCIKEDLESNTSNLSAMIGRKKSQIALNWTTNVLNIYHKYQNFLHSVFDEITNRKDNSYVRILDDVFSEELGGPNKCYTEYISLFLDIHLKQSANSKLLETAKSSLSNCIVLLKFLSERDIFENYYKQQMSKRLLQHRSSVEIEKWMVREIKREMGAFVTIKLEGMLRDISKSLELQSEFKSFLETSTVAVSPKILTVTSWPFGNNGSAFEPVLPQEMSDIQKEFESFYHKKYNERTLCWQYNLELVNLSYTINEIEYELIIPFYGCLILLLFNSVEELTMLEITQMTGLSEEEAQKHLLSLTVAPKCKILKKIPATRTISAFDKFLINYNFKSMLSTIKIPTLISNNNILSGPTRRSEDEMELVRLPELNAAIVRTMKHSKTLREEELKKKVSDILKEKFTLSKNLFRRSILYLLDREYLQQSPDDDKLYHYVA